jgi:hypothetical protein
LGTTVGDGATKRWEHRQSHGQLMSGAGEGRVKEGGGGAGPEEGV